MVELNKINIFNTLSPQDVKEIKPYFIPVSYRKKDVVFSEGDPSDWLYIVLEGKVKITKVSHDGKEIILEIISPVDFFGGIAVVRGFPYPANAIAMEDVELLKVSKGSLMKILDRFPAVMYCMAQNIGERVKDSHDTLKNIALERVESRIASLLLKLSKKAGIKAPEGTLIDMKLTKQDIAEMVGTTVETSIRTMSKFKKLGIVSEKSGKITIKDPAKLKGSAAS
ncbi:MAG: Crp/Fnr family transcriptional regulator [Thermodesulfovibrionales bacterium]|nr:Crp/Fnr family transcriptional regulator [Thermodesulfovibrionales bacterium]